MWIHGFTLYKGGYKLKNPFSRVKNHTSGDTVLLPPADSAYACTLDVYDACAWVQHDAASDWRPDQRDWLLLNTDGTRRNQPPHDATSQAGTGDPLHLHRVCSWGGEAPTWFCLL